MMVVVIYLLTAVLSHMALSANRCTISTCTARAPISRCVASMQLWHERLAHVDPNGSRKNGQSWGGQRSQHSGPMQSPQVCVGCIYGKGHRAPVPKTSTSRSIACSRPRALRCSWSGQRPVSRWFSLLHHLH